MAYLAQDDKIEGQETQTPQVGSSGVPSTVGASGSADVGANVSTAGVGKGGTGGWTNIQAYLGANKDNNSTANVVQNKFGTEFDNEQKQLTDTSAQTKTAAQGEVDKITGARANKNQYVNDASGWYARQTPDYRQGVVSEVQGHLNNQYGGPQDYTYAMGAKAQDYGSRLQNGQFPDTLEDLYREASGGKLTSGQLALQRQLDTNNDALEQTRQSLAGRYSALQNMATDTIADTNSAIGKAKTDYDTQRAGFKSDLEALERPYGAVPEKGGNEDKYKAVMDFLGKTPDAPREKEPEMDANTLSGNYQALQGLVGGLPDLGTGPLTVEGVRKYLDAAKNAPGEGTRAAYQNAVAGKAYDTVGQHLLPMIEFLKKYDGSRKARY